MEDWEAAPPLLLFESDSLNSVKLGTTLASRTEFGRKLATEGRARTTGGRARTEVATFGDASVGDRTTLCVPSVSELSLEYMEFCDILSEFLDISCKCDLRNVLGKFQKIKPTDPIIHEKCVICLDNYERGTYKRVLKCGHVFHKKCVDRWFCKLSEYDKDLTCPICRKKVA